MNRRKFLGGAITVAAATAIVRDANVPGAIAPDLCYGVYTNGYDWPKV